MTSVIIVFSRLTSASASLCFRHVTAVELKRTDAAGSSRTASVMMKGIGSSLLKGEGDENSGQQGAMCSANRNQG